ncbi:MAG: chemotaxis protein [Epsilonproteobacteria bacterium]|nr:chemotaxis protein [Campylobacterota bacterium]OIO17908.1 MAG: chemotaxis protein [Helicobacteraceae bacterium CG1_02_36_14]PIP09313.1 MAG: chemotaxis protein [Sulfurimonas sp. CG23_combo_of_CG06-09_8_20_14_all_36_33]PIS24366.1 MAG: chemotaxis protein [Sulfurimonas sp. CG08_land_8_20_14_0_20_36_33]PIU34451.1 MAG: chemotaxis protein [Sulfurimonas sp. CG07_land_8_20_14_0_80_36_56]PIV03082.1 MAG: chemotaxis protein [Sulfurimonas sp. CG03_land_8_20_14_0_80_36_25]PIV34945.1 MAG: chemotaxis prot
MTQEELDALMNGEIDDIDTFEENTTEKMDDVEQEEEVTTSKSSKEKVVPSGYSDETAHHWPLPATDENKMVHQLDDVTKESEEKASEIFDIIEVISSDLMEKEENLQRVIKTLTANVELFTTLSTKFPEVEAFKSSLAQNTEAITELNETVETLQNSGDSIMNVMDIMQYQDIHRQKIERVINVMRALSKYMNTLFEGKIDDEKRVASATHIVGDTHNDTASVDEIEALLAQFGK